MDDIKVPYEVWRLEDRSNPDAVDFWDFLSERALLFFRSELADGTEEYVSYRRLTDLEVIQTALANYRADLMEGEPDD